MKTIFNITKNELRNLFYTPVAWLVLIIFMVMCAFFYTSLTYNTSKGIALIINEYYELLVARSTSTKDIFNSFFFQVLPNLFMFIPLLTMNVLSREKHAETITLLYSSPITVTQIVLGKYLALMIYNLIFILIIGVFIVSGFFDILSLDYPHLLGACLGLYLLLCAFTAIGFFMSSLTSYQVVSAIATLTFLFVLSAIGGLWQDNRFMRELTPIISISGRTENMLVGLIRSKDIFYYLIIIYFFLSFTLLKLKAGREHRPWYINAARYMMVILPGLLIGYLTSLPRSIIYWDTTRAKVNTLYPQTQQVLKELGDSTLEVTVYSNLFDAASLGLPSNRNAFLQQWEPYTRFRPDIKFNFVYYYHVMPGDSSIYRDFPNKTLQQIAGLVASIKQVDSAMFMPPEEIDKIINLEAQRYTLAVQLKYKGNTRFLRCLPSATALDLDNKSTESAICAALKRLSGTKMPKVAFLTGELERNIYKRGEREYSNIRDEVSPNSLVNLGFDFDTLNLSTQAIPDDLTILALADPKMDLKPVVADKIRNYVTRGGNLLILGEPGKQYVLNPLLSQLGVRFSDGQLAQLHKQATPDKISVLTTDVYKDLAEEAILRGFKDQLQFNIKAVRPFTLFSLKGVVPITAISDSGFTINPLVVTSPQEAWLKAGKLVKDSAPPLFNIMEGDIKEPFFNAGMALTRKIGGKEQRIVVYGDADKGSNRQMTAGIDYLTRSLYSWLADNQFPIYTFAPYVQGSFLAVSPKWVSVQKILYIYVLPGIVLIIGAVLLIRRKRQ